MFAPGCRGVRELPLQSPLRALGARQGGGKQQAAMGIAVHPASERRCGDRLPCRLSDAAGQSDRMRDGCRLGWRLPAAKEPRKNNFTFLTG